jgi:F-type H+-transporting ATPase subunit b
MLFSINATLVVFVVSFLIFMFLLNEVYLKPVGKTLEERAKYIEDQIQAGRQAHSEAGQLQSNYESDLRKIREEAQQVIQEAVSQANRARQEQLGKIAAEGQVKLEKAKQEIEAERAQLIDALVAEETILVETITRKVLGDDSVSIDIDTSAVRRTLEEAC